MQGPGWSPAGGTEGTSVDEQEGEEEALRAEGAAAYPDGAEGAGMEPGEAMLSQSWAWRNV